MKRKNWVIVDAAGFMYYTGDTSKKATGWSSEVDDACLFATESRAWWHVGSSAKFDGCKVKEVQ